MFEDLLNLIPFNRNLEGPMVQFINYFLNIENANQFEGLIYLPMSPHAINCNLKTHHSFILVGQHLILFILRDEILFQANPINHTS